jgi:hypothetical protein
MSINSRFHTLACRCWSLARRKLGHPRQQEDDSKHHGGLTAVKGRYIEPETSRDLLWCIACYPPIGIRLLVLLGCKGGREGFVGVEASQSPRFPSAARFQDMEPAPCFAGVTGETRVRGPSALGRIMQTPEISIGGLIK